MFKPKFEFKLKGKKKGLIIYGLSDLFVLSG